MERGDRIGWWVSGTAHAGLILWALLGGVFLRPQPSAPVRTTEVSTMSGAEFEAYAASARGAGPVSDAATAVTEMPAPDIDRDVASAPAPASAPQPGDSAQAPEAPTDEATPDLSDFAARPAVEAATDLPAQARAPDAVDSTATPAPAQPPAAAAQPARPEAPVADAATAVPRSALALDQSRLPAARPDGLVENALARREAAEAARAADERAAEEQAALAAAEAAAEAAQRQAAADEQARTEATEAAAEQRAADAARRAQAEAEAEAEAQAQARAEAEAQAEARRQAKADAEAADEERRAAEAAAEAEAEAEAAARRAEDERRAAEAERQATEDALREAQQAGAAGSDPATTGADASGGSTMIEGGSGASAEQDPLSAALSGALSGGGGVAQGTDPLQLVPGAQRPSGLPDADPAGPNGTDPAREDRGAEAGAPLTLAERDAFRVAIAECWNVAALSIDALLVTVSVGFEMAPDGRPEPDSLRLVSSAGGTDAAVQNAYDVARRAILSCTRGGYPLPPGKYRRWQQVIVDFRPDGIGVQ